jgi:hypothetical protein
LQSNGTYGCEDCAVNGSSIEKELVAHLLDEYLFCGVDGGSLGFLFSILNFGSIFDCGVWEWLVLRLRSCVLEELEGPLHISRHVQMILAFVVVPSHVYSYVSVSRPLGLDLIVFLEDVHEVVDVFFSNVFDAEVVYDMCERYRSRDVFPQPGLQFALEVSVLVEALFEEFVCEEPCLW